MKISRSILVSAFLLVGLTAFSIGWFMGNNNSDSPALPSIGQTIGTIGTANENVSIKDLDEVWKRLQANYYDEKKLDAEKLKYGAVKGFVAAIGDPYTVFMTPDESKDFDDGLNGNLEGIGAELEVKEGKLVVVTPLKSSPAEKAGLKTNDIIFKIDGALAEELSLYDAVHRIRGKKGTAVTLTIIREKKSDPFEIKIVRAKVVIDSVTVKKLDGDIFHLTVNQFNDHTKTEFQNAVQKILLERARGIILDLRGNGGGYLDISVDMLSELLPGEKVASIIKRRDAKQNESVKTSGLSSLPDIPLVVLVNKGSASASEIVAGAVQDYKRGVIIGEKTFGKGSVQEISRLADGSNLRLTIAKWFTPLDRSIDDTGITPDKIVELTEADFKAEKDPQLDAAIQYLKSKK
ncbi:MAG: S41 family peptidase [Patescibacteria group bacterium]